MDNFTEGLLALTKTLRLFFYTTIFNTSVLGFIAGVFLTIMVAVFILTKDPRHIPHILLSSSTESFQKIAAQDEHGTYTVGFTEFLRMYTQVRMLCLIAFISFCVMVTTVVITR